MTSKPDRTREEQRVPEVESSTFTDDLDLMIDGWHLSLKADNKSDATLKTYLTSARQLRDWVRAEHGPTDIRNLSPTHVRGYLAHVLSNWKATTASVRYRALYQWFKFLLAEGEMDSFVMAEIRPPIVPEEPVGVISDEELAAMLAGCDPKTYDGKRDIAIIRLFFDGGVRLDELASIRLDDLGEQVVSVLGKGRRRRTAAFGPKTAVAIHRYLRARTRHKHASSPALWLGQKGAMTSSGVYQVIRRRGRKAGVTLHPHQLRHTAAHRWLAQGGEEGDLMNLMGWRSRAMLDRYGRSAAEARAIAAHKRLKPGESI